MSLSVDRQISDREIEVVTWLLKNGSTGRPLQARLEGVARLRIVGRCQCGCASVDFEKDGPSAQAHPIAEAVSVAPAGPKCGLILWGSDDVISGLEIYDFDEGTNTELPSVETLRRWGEA
jgi:hypothetical protein